MRLIEFADTIPYTLSTDAAADFLKPLDRIWLHENLAYELGIKKPTPDKLRKPNIL